MPTVFVLGPPRSGTSLLLYMLITGQPAIAGSVRESQFYGTVFRQPFVLKTFLDDTYFNDWLSKEEITRLFSVSANASSFFRSAIQSHLEATGKGVFVEKSPLHTLYHHRLLSDFDKPIFILIERNPAANVQSIAFTRWISLPTDRLPLGLSKAGSIRYFGATLLFYEYWRACRKIERLPETVLHLQYEDLVQSKVNTRDLLSKALSTELNELYVSRPFSDAVTHRKEGMDTSRINDYQTKMPAWIQYWIFSVFAPRGILQYGIGVIARTLVFEPWLILKRIFRRRD